MAIIDVKNMSVADYSECRAFTNEFFMQYAKIFIKQRTLEFLECHAIDIDWATDKDFELAFDAIMSMKSQGKISKYFERIEESEYFTTVKHGVI